MMESIRRTTARHDLEVEALTSQVEEGLAVKFTAQELQDAGKEFVNSIMVKIVGNRGYNRAAFKTVLWELWKPTAGLKFTELKVMSSLQNLKTNLIWNMFLLEVLGAPWVGHCKLINGHRASRLKNYSVGKYSYEFKYITYRSNIEASSLQFVLWKRLAG